jgi:hypothetical protein
VVVIQNAQDHATMQARLPFVVRSEIGSNCACVTKLVKAVLG